MTWRRFCLIPVLMVATLLTFSTNRSVSTSQAAQLIAQTCRSKNNQDCLAKQFRKLTSAEHIKFAFATLEQLQKTNDISRDCHFIAHSIAAAEVESKPSNWRVVLDSLCPTECSYGCSHGAIEAHAILENRTLTEEDLLLACDENSPPACPHGVGHLFLVQTDNNLSRAVADCHKLASKKDLIFQCVSGVFMENSTPTNLLAHGLIKPPLPQSVNRIPELEATCRRYTGSDAAACWQEVAPAVIQKNNFKVEAIHYCDGLPDVASIRICQYRMVDTYAWIHSYDVRSASAICDVPAGHGFPLLCSDFLTLSEMDNLPQAVPSVAQYCLTLKPVPEQHCFGIIGDNFSRKKDSDKALWQKTCQELSEELKKICTNGGNIDVREEPAF